LTGIKNNAFHSWLLLLAVGEEGVSDWQIVSVWEVPTTVDSWVLFLSSHFWGWDVCPARLIRTRVVISARCRRALDPFNL
jgi:hypothetical protein